MLYTKEAEVALVTFSDSNSTPVPKFLNPDPRSEMKLFQISESESCSCLILKQWHIQRPRRFLLLP